MQTDTVNASSRSKNKGKAAKTKKKEDKTKKQVAQSLHEDFEGTSFEDETSSALGGFTFTDTDNELDQEIETNNQIVRPPGIPDQNNLEEEIDIFDYGFAEAQRVADIPKFVIIRNGEHLVTWVGAYSYDRLQRTYGGGHYKIYARRNIDNFYIRGMTSFVAKLPGKSIEEGEDLENKA